MQRNFSQNISGTFEIINYVLLIPGTLGLIISFVTSELFPAVLIIYLIGCVLLTGCILHSRGKLKYGESLALWVGIIIYNACFATVFSYFVISEFLYSDYRRINWSSFGLEILIILAYVAITFFAGAGFNFDRKNNQKYL